MTCNFVVKLEIIFQFIGIINNIAIIYYVGFNASGSLF